jgi:hypothetical protein
MLMSFAFAIVTMLAVLTCQTVLKLGPGTRSLRVRTRVQPNDLFPG